MDRYHEKEEEEEAEEEEEEEIKAEEKPKRVMIKSKIIRENLSTNKKFSAIIAKISGILLMNAKTRKSQEPLATKMFQFARLSLACPWIQQQFERLTYLGISGSMLIFNHPERGKKRVFVELLSNALQSRRTSQIIGRFGRNRPIGL